MKKNVFIDCGTNLGQGLLEFHMMLNMLNSPEWEIHSFEANPDIDLSFPIVHNLSYHKKAVWVKETTIGFMMARRGQSYNDPLGWGNSSPAGELTRLGNHLQIDEINNPNITEALEKVVQVPAIDFSEYLKTFQGNEYGRIVVKMDVEGAEYKIMRHLLEERTAKLIDTLFIETHHHIMPNEDEETTAALLKSLSDVGIQIYQEDHSPGGANWVVK